MTYEEMTRQKEQQRVTCLNCRLPKCNGNPKTCQNGYIKKVQMQTDKAKGWRQKREIRIKAGVCVYCGKRLAEIGYCYCYECRMKHREQDKRYREKIKAKREQNESKTRANRQVLKLSAPRLHRRRFDEMRGKNCTLQAQ